MDSSEQKLPRASRIVNSVDLTDMNVRSESLASMSAMMSLSFGCKDVSFTDLLARLDAQRRVDLFVEAYAK